MPHLPPRVFACKGQLRARPLLTIRLTAVAAANLDQLESHYGLPLRDKSVGARKANRTAIGHPAVEQWGTQLHHPGAIGRSSARFESSLMD